MTTETEHELTPREVRDRLARITPSSSVLLELCTKFPPPPEWYEEEWDNEKPEPPAPRSRLRRPRNNDYCCDGRADQRHRDRQAADEAIAEWVEQ